MSINSLSRFGVPGQNGDRSAVLMPKFSNRFRVTVFNFGNPGEVAPYDMTRAIKSIGRPKVTTTPTTIYSYMSSVYLATRFEWQETTMKVWDDIDNTTARRIQQQISKQQNFFDQTGSRAGENYKFEMHVDVLAGGGFAGASASDPNIIEQWELDGCFIINSDLGELTWDDAKPLDMSLGIRFDNAVMFDHNGNRLGTFDHQTEVDSRQGDFTTGIGGL